MAAFSSHPTTGLDLGYARVSTTKQSLDRQLDALTAAGIPVEQIYTDKKTGANVERDRLGRPPEICPVRRHDRGPHP